MCFYTKDLKKVNEFYIKILGFEIAHKFININGETYGYFIHCGNGTFIEFFLNEDLKERQNINHICFQVDDINIIANKLKKYFDNIEIRRGKTDNVLNFFINDFDGNKIEFHQHDSNSKLHKYISNN